MKKKRMVLTLIAGAMISAAVFGRDYDLNERETISLSGIGEVVFNLEEVSCSLCISSPDILSVFKDALRFQQIIQISYWDSLILAASHSAGCKTIYTEDLNHEQITAEMEICNPFE